MPKRDDSNPLFYALDALTSLQAALSHLLGELLLRLEESRMALICVGRAIPTYDQLGHSNLHEGPDS